MASPKGSRHFLPAPHITTGARKEATRPNLPKTVAQDATGSPTGVSYEADLIWIWAVAAWNRKMLSLFTYFIYQKENG